MFSKYKCLNSYLRDKDIEIADKIVETIRSSKLAIIEGAKGTGKTSLARFIASNVPEKTVFWLSCGHITKFESSLRDMARSLNIPYYITEPLELKKEIQDILTGKDKQEFLLILDEAENILQILDLLSELPPNVSILIAARNEDFLSGLPKFKLDLFNFDEIVQFITETTECYLNADELAQLRVTLQESWSPSDTEIALPVITVNQIAFYLNNILVKKTPSELTDNFTTLQIIENHLNPDSLTKSIANLFSQYKTEIGQIIYLDADFIDLSLLTHKLEASDNHLDSFLNELEHYGFIYRAESCCGDKGIAINKLFQKIILDNFGSEDFISESLNTIEFFLNKVLVGSRNDARESHKAYMHALKLFAFRKSLSDDQVVRLLSSITEYQRYWRIDGELCLQLLDVMLQIEMAKFDSEDLAFRGYLNFAMGKTYFVFERYEEAFESLTWVVSWCGRNSYEIVMAYNMIARCLIELGEYEEAVNNLNCAVRMMVAEKNNDDVLNLMMREYWLQFNLIGICLSVYADRVDRFYEEAKLFFKVALRSAQQMLGWEDRLKALAEINQNLARLYAGREKNWKAVKHFKRAADNLMIFFGDYDSKVADAYVTVAEQYAKMGLWTKARKYYVLGFGVNAHIYGPYHRKSSLCRINANVCEQYAKLFWSKVVNAMSFCRLKGN